MDIEIASVLLLKTVLYIGIHVYPSFQTLPDLFVEYLKAAFVLRSNVHLLVDQFVLLSVGCDDVYENILMLSANYRGNFSPK